MRTALHYAPIALLLGLWELLSRTGVIAADVLPAFSQVMIRLGQLSAGGDLFLHIGA